MNRRVSTVEVKENLSSILHEIEEGETFLIVSNGEPVARILPVEKGEFLSDQDRARAHRELLEHLRQVKAIDIGPWTRAELYEDEE